jgi:tetratricopeptide (TPR) repeat protein
MSGHVGANDTRVGAILDEYLRGVETGIAPDRGTLLAKHPELAAELAAAFRGLDFVRNAAPSLAETGDVDAEAGRTLGEYKLLREVGRGGMAVVYEAEQVSLGRRVALKVLPFAAVLDPKQLQRFKNEALAAAQLHHPHIVPVYSVGCERGVHYYAMQYIEGQSLALAICEMRAGRGGSGSKTPLSSHTSNREPGYVRMAAGLGMQAAEALDHAHQLGIVHRDVKPGNLLVDQAGSLQITDFGLARSRVDVGLTVTGEILGTIRYMSPEQAQAKRVPIDHRTDVYSLGATLYELFTLEPAFPGDDPHQVIQELAYRDPVPPRKLNPVLPVDLETVLQKAMSKDPANRYATAQEMADDLGRFLEDRPILARRPPVPVRAARWARRRKGLVMAASGVLFLGIAALAADAYRVGRALEEAESNLRLARDAVDRFLVEVGVSSLREKPLPPASYRVLLEKALQFLENYVDDPESFSTRAVVLHALHRYGEALSACDHVLAARPQDARALAERGHQLWHLQRYDEALENLQLAIAIDPDLSAARFHLGRALDSSGEWYAAVAAYRDAIRLDANEPTSHLQLGIVLLEGTGDPDAAILEFREAIRLQPDDGPAHYNLGIALKTRGDLDAAIEAYREAIRLAPDDSAAHYNLGNLLLDRKGDADAAIPHFRAAIRIRPDYAFAHNNLGNALDAKGEVDAAIEAYRKAIRLEPHLAEPYNGLGNVLSKAGDSDEAIAMYREAIRLEPDHFWSHNNLGAELLEAKGDPDAAILEFREAIRIQPERAFAHNNLGNALRTKGDVDAAMEAYGEAIRLDPNLPEAHYGLGVLLVRSDPDTALQELREAIRIQPDYASAHSSIGNALWSKGEVYAAMQAYRDAIRLEPDLASVHHNLGALLNAVNDPDGALREFREALRLEESSAGHGTVAWLLAVTDRDDLRDPVEALVHARRAVELTPGGANDWENLGVALYVNGEYKQAQEALDHAVELGGADQGSRSLFLALCHDHLGRHDEAERWFERAQSGLEELLKSAPDLQRFVDEATNASLGAGQR